MGHRRIKSFTGSSKKECLKRVDEFLKKNQMDLINITADSTIAEIAEQKVYRDYRKNILSESGYDRRLTSIAIIRDSNLGDIPVTQVSVEMIREFLDSITHYSNSVIKSLHYLIALPIEYI